MSEALLPRGKAYYEAWHKADEKMRPPGMTVPVWELLPVGVKNEWIIMDEVARSLYAAVPPDAVVLSSEEREALRVVLNLLATETGEAHWPIGVKYQWIKDTHATIRALLARAGVKA